MKFKRIASGLLAAALLLGLTACGKEETDPAAPQTETAKPGKQEAQVEEVPSKLAYKPTYVDLKAADGSPIRYVQQFTISGDDLVFYGNYEVEVDPETADPDVYYYVKEDGTAVAEKDGLFRMNLTTGEVTELQLEQPTVPEGMESSTYVQSLTAGADGSFWVQQQVSTYSYNLPDGLSMDKPEEWPENFEPYEYYVEGENTSSMIHYDKDGKSLGEAQLELPADMYVQRFCFDSKGRFYVSNWENVLILDETGKLVKELSSASGGDLVQLSADQIGLSTYSPESGAQVVKLLDLDTLEFGKELKVPMMANKIYPGRDGYDFLYQTGDSVYGYQVETEKEEKLFSWLDCDVDTNNMNSDAITFLTDGRVAAMEFSHDAENSTTKLLLLEPADPATIPQKEEMVLGCFYLDYGMRTMIVNFNRAHDDVRIKVRDYGEMAGDGDYEDAVQKMNTEILSGKGPDLISASGLPMERYAAKGIFLDLWPMIDADPELSRDQLMEHFFDAASTDGKLYTVSNSFNIQTAACKKSLTGDKTSWTLEEMLEALHTLQPGATVFGETDTKGQMLSNCLGFNMDAFVDWESGTTSFDSPEFISLLEFANTFHDEIDWENYDWESRESDYSRINSGKQLMSTAYISDFNEVQVKNAYHGGEVNFIGYPTESGHGSAFQMGTPLSISASCKNPDLAWSFARELLLEENQNGRSHHMFGFPTNKAAFDAMAKEAMTPVYEEDPETGEKVEISQSGIGIDDDFSLEIYACTQQEYDTLMAVYENCSSVYSYNQEIMDLINEEAAPFFAGQKTAEETAKLIQGRVGLYIMEQG